MQLKKNDTEQTKKHWQLSTKGGLMWAEYIHTRFTLCFCSIDSSKKNLWFAVIKVQCSIERKFQYNRIIQLFLFNTILTHSKFTRQWFGPPSLTPPTYLEIFSSPYSFCPFETYPSWQMCAIILKIFMVRWFVANFFSMLITGNCVFVENQKCGKNAHSNSKAKSSINRKSLRRFLCKFLWNQITKAFARTHAFKHTPTHTIK